MPKQNFIQIESKNALLELLKDGREFERIFIATDAYKDVKTKEIIQLASNKQVPIVKVSRRALLRKVRKSSYESVVGMMVSENMYTLSELLDKLHKEDMQPFFLILDHIKYEQNIGAIMRTAFAAGVNGVITPVKKGNLLTSEIARISMGASERIPFVEMNLFAAFKSLKKEGIKIFGLTMEGKNFFKTNLTGPAAFVLGAEDVGISGGILERVDEKISIPMREGIGSLNVSASGAILMYEKLRQEVA